MWIFDKRNSFGVFAVPKNEEFFVSERRDVPQSLVREVTQNSGDAAIARTSGEPVRVRFAFGEVDRTVFAKYCMSGLREHLEACDPQARAILDDTRPVRFLAIEDFGTTGLTGVYGGEYDDSSNFINFWRRYGESGKQGASGGRHGVGKSTISSASQLRFFFGITKRHDDGELLLYGQSTLRPHRLADEHAVYDPYGLFSPATPPEDPLPFVGSDAEWFLDTFGLDRGEQPGLSLVIPFPRSDLTEDAVVRAAIEHCFHQIVGGQLVVTVGQRQLDRTTIQRIAEENTDLSHFGSAIALSIEATSEEVPPPIQASESLISEDRLSEEHFSEIEIAKIRAAWAQGRTVHVKLPLQIRPKESDAQIGYASLFLRQESDRIKARETYVRGRVTVIGRTFDPPIAVSLLVADKGIVSKFLGDSEPPAHDQWIQNKLKADYDQPHIAHRRIKHALKDRHAIAVGAKEDEPLKDALSAYLWSFEPKERENQTEKPKSVVPPIVPGPPSSCEFGKTKDGFTFIVRQDAASVPSTLRIDVRYRVRRGKPKWSPADFTFEGGQIHISKKGEGTIDTLTCPGSIILRDALPGFQLTATGFDANRDLYLHAVEPSDGD